MEKTTKINAETFMDAVEQSNVNEATNISGTLTETWHGIDVTIKRTLSLKEMLTFVDNVVKTCFSANDGSYIPEVKDFSIKKCILEIYANFTFPEDAEECYALIYESDAFDFVLDRINRRQLTEIVKSADEKMKHLAQSNIEMVNRQMNELYAAFDSLQKQIAGAFSGINTEDISKLMDVISNGRFDEEKIVKAFINERSSQNKVTPMKKRGE